MTIILILTIIVLGAFFIIFSRIGLSKTEKLSGTLFILTIASFTGVIAGFILNPKAIFEFTIVAFGWILLYAFLQNGLGRTFNLLSIGYLGANRSTPIITTAQIFNALFAWLIVSESPSIANLLGLICIVTGCIMVSIETMGKDKPLALKKKTAILGIIIAIVSAIGYGLSAPIAKYSLNASISPGFIITFSSLITLTVLIVPTIKKLNTIKTISKSGIYALIAGGILSGIINAILIYTISFKEIIYIIPLVSTVPIPTLFIAKILLPKTEVFTKYIIFGTIATVIGAILIGLEI